MRVISRNPGVLCGDPPSPSTAAPPDHVAAPPVQDGGGIVDIGVLMVGIVGDERGGNVNNGDEGRGNVEGVLAGVARGRGEDSEHTVDPG